jgi:hypothetical protein
MGRGTAAFLYQNGEAVIFNNLLPDNSEWWLLERAVDINNKGQIVGYGYVQGIRRYCAFLMNPITLEGDLNNDGIVDLKDLDALADQWLMTEPCYE